MELSSVVLVVSRERFVSASFYHGLLISFEASGKNYRSCYAAALDVDRPSIADLKYREPHAQRYASSTILRTVAAQLFSSQEEDHVRSSCDTRHKSCET